MSKLAIIGTAGRYSDGKQLATDPKRYLMRMLDAAREVSRLTGATELISGGAAWSDHIAVLLFIEDPERYSLELELPAALEPNSEGGLKYHDKGTRDFKDNPGAVSNHYHHQFNATLAKSRLGSSFVDFFLVSSHPKVTINVGTGFLERNLVVAAKAHHCLAMTFGDDRQLKEGGTMHTMKAFLSKRDHGQSFHLDLNTLKLWNGCVC